MGQNNTVMAFRKRLRKRGYTDIHIMKSHLSGLYYVSAVEPVFMQKVFGKMTEEIMYQKLAPKRIR